MTQIGPRFSTQDNLSQLRHNRQDNKVNLSQPQGVASTTALEDLQGALNTQSNEVLIATDIQQNGQVKYMVLTRAEAETLLNELETLAQSKESIELSDIQFPESVHQRHGSEVSNQNAQLVQNLYQDKSIFNLKLGPAELNKNAIHLNQHYDKRLGQVNQNLQKLDAQLQSVQNRIESLEVSGENPGELQQLKQEQQVLQGLNGMLKTQQGILQEQAQIRYSWNKQPTPPEQLERLGQLAEQLQTQVGEMQLLLQNSPIAAQDPRLGAQLQMLTEQAGTMGLHLTDCVNYCQDPEMSSARTVVDKELNLNAVMRDYENTLDLIQGGRRVAPKGFPPETPDLQGFKNSTLNDQSYSQAYQRVFSSWNQEIEAVDFQGMLEAPDGEAQLGQLRADMAARIDKQFKGPEGYTIAPGKVAQVKKLFDDHIMSGHAQALAARAGTLPQPSEKEIRQALNVTQFGEAALPQHQIVVADNTRVVQPLQPHLLEMQNNIPDTPVRTELQQQTTQAAIDNHSAKVILPTLTGTVPTGFGKPAQNGLNQVHSGTQNTIAQTETQIQTNHHLLRDHYKLGNLELNSLPGDVRLDIEQNFIEGVVQDQDQDLSISMTHKDWPPLNGVRQNIGDFGQAYNAELQKLMQNAEVGSDAHTFMRCMQALELYEDPKYKDQIDYDQLINNIADLKDKLKDDFAACEAQAKATVFGGASQQIQRAEAIKQNMLSENFIQRLAVLPPQQAKAEIEEALSLIGMLNPTENLGALAEDLQDKMQIILLSQNPAEHILQLSETEQKQVLDESKKAFEALSSTEQEKILAELEEMMQSEIKPGSQDIGTKDVLKSVKGSLTPVDRYANYIKAMGHQGVLSKMKSNGSMGALGGLLSFTTMALSGVDFNKETVSGICGTLSKADDCRKIVSKLGSSGISKAFSTSAKLTTRLKALGPVGDAIGTYTATKGSISDFKNGDNIGGTLKGFEALGSGMAVVGGGMVAYTSIIGASAAGGPVLLIAGTLVALAAWGLDEWLGESEQETIIRQAGCQKEQPPSPASERLMNQATNPYYMHPGKI